MAMMLHETTRAWSFAEDFDLTDAAEPAGAEPEFIDPIYSFADLEAARAQAAAQARALTIDESTRSEAAQATAACAAIAQCLAASDAAAASLAEAVAASLASAILAALRACLPALYRRHGVAEAACLIGALMPALRCLPRAVISLHPSVLDSVAAASLLDGCDPDRLSLRADAQMEPGDVRVAWEDGGARRDLATLLAALDAALDLDGLLEGADGR